MPPISTPNKERGFCDRSLQAPVNDHNNNVSRNCQLIVVRNFFPPVIKDSDMETVSICKCIRGAPSKSRSASGFDAVEELGLRERVRKVKSK